MNTNDQELFNQVKKGNKLAFQTLFRRYYAAIARFINRYVNDESTAEEVAQELFISFWENAPCLKITISFKAYLYTSAKNFAINYLKKANTRTKYHKLAHEIQNSEIDRIEYFNKKEFNELIIRGLETLPEKCKEIFVLGKYEGLTYEEIADYMGLSKKTVENQMGIGLRKLREWIQPYLSRVFQ